MADLIVGGILLVIVGAAIFYIVKAKKKGIKCIGCPAAGQCAGGSKARVENCAHCKGHCSQKV